MQRSESVGSVTSLLVNVKLHDEQTPDQLIAENERLRELVHDKVAQISWYRDTNDKLMHDAARWNFAKRRYCLELGYDTPEKLQAKVDKDMITPEPAIDVLMRKSKK